VNRRKEIGDALRAVLAAVEAAEAAPVERTSNGAPVVIHSSLPALGLEALGLKWDLLAAISRLLDDNRTLFLPTFTFSFCRGRPYHFRRSLGETGQLGNWFLELAKTSRTPHPIYSFAVAGPRMDELSTAANSTTFGDDSIFARFERLDAQLVMFGCDWDACTQFHRYEEQFQVPYRDRKTFHGSADFGAGPVRTAATMYVRDDATKLVNDFSPAVTRLREAGLIASRPLGAGLVQAVRCRSLAAVCRELLSSDPLAFVKERAQGSGFPPAADFGRGSTRFGVHRSGWEEGRGGKGAREPRGGGDPNPIANCKLQIVNSPRSAFRAPRSAFSAPPQRIALLGQGNLALLRSALVNSARELLPDRELEVYIMPFGQLFQEVLAPDSALRRFPADLSIAVDRLEDVLQIESLDELDDLTDADDRVGRYVELLESYLAARQGPLIVNTLVQTQLSVFGAFGQPNGDGDHVDRSSVGRNDIARFNAQFEALGRRYSNLRLFDLARAAAAFCDGPLCDPRLAYLGRFPYSAPFSEHLAREYLGWLLALQGRTARLIVLDLDNTLWGGVLGEDGMAGLQLGGDYPGNAFAAFQRTLKHLATRGVALALASKNDADDALLAIRTLPSMVLTERDFAIWRINWLPKWRNIESIANELSLGLEHVLFVDDNPAEREQVRRQLPDVRVLELPADPALYSEALLSSPFLKCLSLTDEDRRRNGEYRARRERDAQRRSFERVEDFYASLGSRIHIQPLDEGNVCRAEQLARKTNQFNATTRQYTRRQLESLANDERDSTGPSWGVYVIGSEDRFSQRENIGLLIARWRHPHDEGVEIDNFLLSCRVLGRGIECGVLGWLCRQAARRGVREMFGEIVPTPRNTPVRSLYRDHGFERAEGDGRWRLDLRSAPVDIPSWLSVVDHTREVVAEISLMSRTDSIGSRGT
jgi:FkbH-like protein